MRHWPTLLMLALMPPVLAQEPVAPTDERVGAPRGASYGDYNILQSWELGVRFHSVRGNEGKYRSDVNYGNGLRLLSGRFSMNSKDGRGKFFDEITFASQGLGNDPYQMSTLRVSRNRLYAYNFLWRENAYYNPALAISNGQHLMDTFRRLQDHDLTLFPQSRFRFFAGYSRNVQDGPALTTVLQFDGLGDQFPLFSDVNRRQSEYRVGGEARVAGFRLNVMHVREHYKEDSPSNLTGPSVGNNPADGVSLQSLSRTEPWSGDTPSWRVNLFRESRLWALNGRFTNSAGRRAFLFDESVMGTGRFGPRNRQITVGGDAQRPVTTGQLTVSLFPMETITVTNHTAFHNTRIEGNANYTELENSDLAFSSVDFDSLGIRAISNVTDVNWRISARASVNGGMQFADRLVRSREHTVVFGSPFTVEVEQSNRLYAGIIGFRLQPSKELTLAAGGEIGRQDRPFYPTSDKDYHGFNARALWKKNTLTLSAMGRLFYNFNSVSLSSHSARNRYLSFDSSWTPRDWLAFDVGYSFIHADTATWLSYFVAFRPVQGEQSYYISNLHTLHAAAHVSLGRYADLALYYSRSEDTGGTRRQAPEPFYSAQTYPMLFDSPSVRLSVRLHNKIRWNVGYQHYRYLDGVLSSQNYRAHTGFTSILWTF